MGVSTQPTYLSNSYKYVMPRILSMFTRGFLESSLACLSGLSTLPPVCHSRYLDEPYKQIFKRSTHRFRVDIQTHPRAFQDLRRYIKVPWIGNEHSGCQQAILTFFCQVLEEDTMLAQLQERESRQAVTYRRSCEADQEISSATYICQHICSETET